MDVKRYAIVSGQRTPDEVRAYLPGNYNVEGEAQHDGRRVVVISGRDEAGWTLQDYVSPRLGSGSMGCEEIDLSHPIMRQVPVQTRQLNRRDYNYIEARLLGGAPDLLDAHKRLQAAGRKDEATRLMEALMQLSDECRSIRRELGQRP